MQDNQTSLVKLQTSLQTEYQTAVQKFGIGIGIDMTAGHEVEELAEFRSVDQVSVDTH